MDKNRQPIQTLCWNQRRFLRNILQPSYTITRAPSETPTGFLLMENCEHAALHPVHNKKVVQNANASKLRKEKIAHRIKAAIDT